MGAGATLTVGGFSVSVLWGSSVGGSFKSRGVVLDPSQVQVVIPSLCVFIHAVMMSFCGWCFIVLASAADVGRMSLVS